MEFGVAWNFFIRLRKNRAGTACCCLMSQTVGLTELFKRNFRLQRAVTLSNLLGKLVRRSFTSNFSLISNILLIISNCFLYEQEGSLHLSQSSVFWRLGSIFFPWGQILFIYFFFTLNSESSLHSCNRTTTIIKSTSKKKMPCCTYRHTCIQ